MEQIIAKKGDRIYIDTNILIYFSFKKQNPSRYKLLSLMEFRRKFTELYVTSGVKDLESIRQKTEDAIKNIFKINNLFPVGNETDPSTFYDVIKNGYRIIIDYRGNVVE